MTTVLLVEDSLTDLEIETRYLQEAGFRVITATSVEEAEMQLAKNRPDIIVLDIILPGQSGFEFCRELKSNPSTTGIPIILCSTKNTNVDKMWGKELGADDHLAKPVDKDDLVSTVRRLAQ